MKNLNIMTVKDSPGTSGDFDITDVTDRIRNGDLTVGEARTLAAKMLGLPTWAVELYPPATRRKALRKVKSDSKVGTLRKKWQDMNYPCPQSVFVQ